MLIGHPKQLNRAKDSPDLEVEDEKFSRVQKKYLCVIIDESMNWEEHLKTVKRKIKNGLGAIFKLKNILSQKQLVTVTFTYDYLFAHPWHYSQYAFAT